MEELLGRYKTNDGHTAIVDRFKCGKFHGRIMIDEATNQGMTMIWGPDFKAWGSEKWDLKERMGELGELGEKAKSA